ncbi:DUF4249 domain-containing protein [Mesonia sp. MT50]|uniref:DUF4249 domain-containing protein n=1 Tax=Mesonia profundi TaxID=3070998 RepID=A0ABU1A1M1_9FLAO|nr:DUF4249 domain-containing protein [Mesonia profundi]MDQ7917603.1 DUF4249 domain-containing protein [Mesonia profundi]
MKNIKSTIFFLIGFGTLLSCTEPYELSSDFFEEQIVIEASISNRLEKQRIKVSKTYPIDSISYQPANTGTSVKVKNDQGAEYAFSYNEEDSTFISEQAFKGEPNITYTLEVATANDVYTATSKFENSGELDSISVNKAFNEDGVEGLQIAVNSNDVTNTNKYYRFKYESTYKVTAPYYSPYKAVIVGLEPEYPWMEPIEIVMQEYDEDIYHEVCYKSEASKKAILTTTEDFSESSLVDYPIKFISKADYSLNERYSIKITQYIQSLEAYNFYKALNGLSSEGNILSPNQPGFVNGNIRSVNISNKKVIGFFEVVPTSSKRVYFNHQDFFPGEPIPEYFRECEVRVFDKTDPLPPAGTGQGYKLQQYVTSNSLYLWKTESFISQEMGFKNFFMVKPECGDCAVLANPEPPEFWEE